MKEIWKNIKGYEGLYMVSNLGNVIRNGKILKSRLSKDGYCRVLLCKNSIAKDYYTHRLVAAAFIPNIENKPTVNHKNGIVSDNKVSNLEWNTHSEQNYHLYKMGLKDLSYMSKLREKKWEKYV